MDEVSRLVLRRPLKFTGELGRGKASERTDWTQNIKPLVCFCPCSVSSDAGPQAGPLSGTSPGPMWARLPPFLPSRPVFPTPPPQQKRPLRRTARLPPPTAPSTARLIPGKSSRWRPQLRHSSRRRRRRREPLATPTCWANDRRPNLQSYFFIF